MKNSRMTRNIGNALQSLSASTSTPLSLSTTSTSQKQRSKRGLGNKKKKKVRPLEKLKKYSASTGSDAS